MASTLKARGLSKSFGTFKAVQDISLEIKEGEVLALLGENGAGKSTLTNLLAGVLSPDEGEIWIDGHETQLHSPMDAQAAGVSVVFQELTLTANLTVAENIFMNRQPTRWGNLINWRKLRRQSREALERMQLKVRPTDLVADLSIGQRQEIEILKAISSNPKIMILDEPTSSLTEDEIRLLFENIRRLKAEGMSFIYITHHLHEVFEISDRVMVLRDGRHIATRPTVELDENAIISLMVGREIQDLYGTPSAKNLAAKPVIFRAENISLDGQFEDLSFEVRETEILGISGLVGAGRSEMALSLFGMPHLTSGSVEIDGKPVTIRSPGEAMDAGLGYLTEDRKNIGLFLSFPIRANMVSTQLKRFTNRLGAIEGRKTMAFAQEAMGAYNIRNATPEKPVGALSGGNQQKTLFTMWMSKHPRVLIVDEPTRGVDVGAKSEIYARIREFADSGHGVIVISSDMPEIMGLCDRTLVMHQNKIVGDLNADDFSEERILSFAAGINPWTKETCL
ncbi:MAG: sugar ABC transporter ATP-binding protein [Pseudomonadota bacterium]|nr:sugar ABC transporter ATP-binding protein [Pseudomonadota bacterium]